MIVKFWESRKAALCKSGVKGLPTVGQQKGSLQNICLGVEKGKYF